MTIRIPRWLLWCVGGFILLIAVGNSNPLTYHTRDTVNRGQCQGNLQAIALACAQYRQDTNGRFPPVSNSRGQGWADLLVPYVKSREVYQCPSGKSSPWQRTSDYFFNAQLAKAFANEAPTDIVVFGDGPDNGGTNSNLSALPTGWDAAEPANYDKYKDPTPMRRHIGRANYVFIDGHFQSLAPDQIHTLHMYNAE